MYRILTASKDAYITNKIINNSFRATDANVGQAGTLDLFKLYDETTLSDGIAATAQITIVDTTGNDTTAIQHLHGINGFVLTDSDGLAKEYIFDKNDALGATGTADSEGIVIQVNGMTKASAVAAQVENAINNRAGSKV